MDMYENFRKVIGALGELSDALAEFDERLTEARQRLNALLNTPYFRRKERESELGYAVPDWVWVVEEQQRRTFGSGNGRELRD